MSKTRAGVRFNVIVILGVVGLLAIIVLLIMNQSAPEAAAEEFMQALAKKDVKKLTELSYMENPETPLEQQWSDCVNNKAKTYVFLWVWEGSRRESADEAVMRLHLIEFKGAEQSDSEIFEMPLVRKDGRWKVDLRSLSRKFFPALPR